MTMVMMMKRFRLEGERGEKCNVSHTGKKKKKKKKMEELTLSKAKQRRKEDEATTYTKKR